MSTRCVIGLDLGQALDPSALAVVRFDVPRPAAWDGAWQDTLRPRYTIQALKRWPLRTSYLAIANDVAQIVRERSRSGAMIVPDATGVGKAAIEMIGRALQATGHCQCMQPPCRCGAAWQILPVTITAGQGVAFPADDWIANVSKTALVSSMQVVLQARRLRIAKAHPEAATLKKEMSSFGLKVSESGAVTFAAKRTGGSHGDLLMSCLLAIWAAERFTS